MALGDGDYEASAHHHSNDVVLFCLQAAQVACFGDLIFFVNRLKMARYLAL